MSAYIDWVGILVIFGYWNRWICIRQQQPIPEEEEMPETPKATLDSNSSKSLKPTSSGFGLSWDFGSSAGDNSLFGGDMDIMAMLNKMEKKETQKSKPAPSVVVTPVEAKPSVTPKISPGIPITDSQRPKFPEYFLDVGNVTNHSLVRILIA